MTQEEYKEAVKNDQYLIPRKNRTEEYELRLFLREVDYHCPLCGKELQSRHQKKLSEKMFQIAHIYPNRPTKEQYETFYGLERLGDNCEAFENRIALCKDCHGTQDFHTTKDEYLHLSNLKKNKLEMTALLDITASLGLEQEIEQVIINITNLTSDELSALNYEPVPLANKFEPNELVLKTKIAGYVTTYFPYVRGLLKDLEGKNNFSISVLCGQIKACFEKMETITTDKNAIFQQMVSWIKNRAVSNFQEACEVVVSFFVQDCEVFHEIT